MTIGIYKKTAKDIMTTHVTTINSRDSVHDALALMADNRLTSLPVLDPAGRCVGVISQSDVISVARDADAENALATSSRNIGDMIFGRVPLDAITNERVEDVMTDGALTAKPNELVTSIADKMISQQVHHIPVCDADQRVLGIVSTMDILAALRAPLTS